MDFMHQTGDLKTKSISDAAAVLGGDMLRIE